MIINLTPHNIVVFADNNKSSVFAPSGTIAHCTEITIPAPQNDEAPFVRKKYGDVVGLPDPEPGKMYIVSALVRLAVPDQSDVCSPGDQVRDASGQVIGCKNLVIN